MRAPAKVQSGEGDKDHFTGALIRALGLSLLLPGLLLVWNLLGPSGSCSSRTHTLSCTEPERVTDEAFNCNLQKCAWPQE